MEKKKETTVRIIALVKNDDQAKELLKDLETLKQKYDVITQVTIDAKPYRR
ncbi:hypothetical protein [Enterococcus mundtii]|uniref:hypothetical protein n=1 Tax=Enterococcus mundtii TaxID=53346 RepID=UPI0004505B8B|nr:hypothetical protein [Enterococcus mundtii]EYT95228.1 hypothetical protein AK89_09685 [Enterococcus mundtii CRL35]